MSTSRSGPGGSAATALRNRSWSVWAADVVRARSNIGVSVGAGCGWSDVSLCYPEGGPQLRSTRCSWCFPHTPARTYRVTALLSDGDLTVAPIVERRGDHHGGVEPVG